VKQELKAKGISVITPLKSNMQQTNSKRETQLLKKYRRVVETSNGQLTEHFSFDQPGGKSERGVRSPAHLQDNGSYSRSYTPQKVQPPTYPAGPTCRGMSLFHTMGISVYKEGNVVTSSQCRDSKAGVCCDVTSCMYV
jgi:hypothetical protein